MFKNRHKDIEYLDDASLHGVLLEKNLKNLASINHLLGYNKLVIRQLQKLLHAKSADSKKDKISIADLGCGGGDLINDINLWSKQNTLSLELYGFDKNPACIQFCSSQYPAQENIHFMVMDIFSADFAEQQFDIILLNSICHHFDDRLLARLFSQLKNQTRLGIIITDIHRHILSYLGIKIMTLSPQFSHLEKHDGPVSVLRGFKRHELDSLLRAAGIKNYNISWHWPFRYAVVY